MRYRINEINEEIAWHPAAFAERCEAEYDARVKEAARSIAENVGKSPVILLSGPSGAGKSTLANALLGSERSATGEISERLRRGKNTTRHCELFTADGLMIFDTPGFTSFDLEDIASAGLAGLYPAAALIEILNEDGTMARLPQLEEVAKKYNMKIVTIKDLIAYRLKSETTVERGPEVMMPTKYGQFKMTVFRQLSNGLEHSALVKGTWEPDEPILVRVHSSCATGDIFGSFRCDCGDQLHTAMQQIDKAGKGILLYMNQEGRGIGLFNKIKAYKLQEEGMDTVDANVHLGFDPDERDYGVGAEILRQLGVRKMRLLTNNPVKRVGLESFGLEIIENVPIEIPTNSFNQRYMMTKRDRMGHILKNLK